MKKYFLPISLLLFYLSGDAQMDKFSQAVVFSDTVVEDSFFVSQTIDIYIAQPTPFGYLSAYSETHHFQGAVYQRNKIAGVWTTWQKMNLVPSEEHSERVVFQGLAISAEAEAIQFKTSELMPSPFNYRLYNPGNSENKTPKISAIRSKDFFCEQPDFCGRDCWCPDDNCPTDQTPVATSVTHIIVHHSAANTRSDDFPAVVRSYWDFHVNTRGWDDVGYNWLIDANGVIYEGRGEERLGAHFSCMNEETVGICLIGNFEEDKPTQAALDALQQFVAWEAHKGAIDVTASGYHTNSQLELDFMAGHRDGSGSLLACSSTVCPGENLYSELPLLRTLIADMPCMDEDVATNIEELGLVKELNIFPNPSNGAFNLSFYAKENSQANLSIISTTGQSFNMGRRDLQQGDNLLSFSAAFLAPGIYFLNMKGENIAAQERVVVIE